MTEPGKPAVSEELGYLKVPVPKLTGPPTMYMSSETFSQKVKRKTKENPFVPIGLSVTVFALSYGLWQMKNGDKKMSQKMMRLRVVAQTFTLFSIIGGVAYSAFKTKKEKAKAV